MSRARSRPGGFVLIELVVAVAIIALLVGAYFGLSGRLGQKKTMPGQVMDRAKDVECRSNLQQLRDNIRIMTMEGQPPPSSLSAAVSGLGDIFTKCPVGGEQYVYDPQTGSVRCPHPGHESF